MRPRRSEKPPRHQKKGPRHEDLPPRRQEKAPRHEDLPPPVKLSRSQNDVDTTLTTPDTPRALFSPRLRKVSMTTEGTSPTPTPEPAKKKQTHGAVNKAREARIVKAEKVFAAATKPEYNAKLITDGEVLPATIAGIETDCVLARTMTGLAVDKTTDKEAATAAEQAFLKELLRLVRYVQAGARRKLGPIQQKDYFIGQPIEKSEDLLIAASIAIEEKLKTQTLPGVKPDTKDKLRDARLAVRGGDDAQKSKQSDASRERVSIDDVLKRIDNNRREVQLAAEGLWPCDDPANRPIRVEFQLPPDKPYIATAGTDDEPEPTPPT